MERGLEYFFQDIVTEKDRRMIYSVLGEYDFEIIDFTRIKNIFKVKTDKGYICLKKTKNGKYKPYNGGILAKELTNKGFFYTPKYYTTKNNNDFVKYKKFIFYVTEWIDGQECNLDNIDEAKNCVKLLAQYHIITKNIDMKKVKVRNNLKNWPQIFKENIYDIENFEKFIDNKRIKTEFDTIYLEHIENMLCKAIIALNFLNTSQYYRILKEAELNKTISNKKIYSQNIIKREDKYYIVDLEGIEVDMQIHDLARIIKKVMPKKNYKWEFNKAKELIEAYSSVKKLNKSELEVILAFVIFPYKFWKLGKRRYVKRKKWDENKYMKKLTKIIRFSDTEEKFLQDYLAYLKCYGC